MIDACCLSDTCDSWRFLSKMTQQLFEETSEEQALEFNSNATNKDTEPFQQTMRHVECNKNGISVQE